jgi:hypothetical protein
MHEATAKPPVKARALAIELAAILVHYRDPDQLAGDEVRELGI